ncbi:MAG: hypothetical protein P8170_13295 [Gemmatimonadota bacterium]
MEGCCSCWWTTTGELHGIPLEDVEISSTAEALRQALAAGGGTRVLRVRTERAESARRRAELADAVARRVRQALT